MVPLIAAGIGLAGTIGSAYLQNKSATEAQKRELAARQAAADELKGMSAKTDSDYGALINQIGNYYDTRGSLGSQADVNAYKQAIASYNPNDYAAEIGDFNYGKTVDDFANPYYAQIIGQTRDALQHTAAGAGLGRGTGAAMNIAQGVASKSDELYNTAMNQYNQDRQFQYQKYADAIRNNQNRLNAINTAQQYKLGLQGNLASDYYNAMDSRQSDIMAANQDRLNAQVGYGSAIAGLY